MRILAFLGMAAGIVCGASTLTTPARAFTAYLSRTGGGSSCTFTSPCNAIQPANTAAGAGGEVICLDKGPYSFAQISFAITISCGDGLWEEPGGIVFINVPAGAAVVIEGLVADSNTASGTILSFLGQGSLHLRRVRIGNNPGGSGNFAINFQPTGPAKLFVTDSRIDNFGSSGVSGAILLKPASGVTANVVIERTSIENNRFGIIADGSAGGTIRGRVSDSSIAGNVNNGITVSTTGSNVVLTVDNTKVSGNNFGLVASGSNAGMLVRHSIINGNNTGLNTGSGGVLLSYGDNSVNANGAGETFSGPVGLK